MTGSPIKYILQGVVILGVTAFLGYFADAPVSRYGEPGMAQIKMSFLHRGARIGECRRLSREEMAALPPNMRKPTECPRGRLPVRVVIQVDGATVYDQSLAATGLFGDSAALAYAKISLPPGRHGLLVSIRDTAREEGYDHQRDVDINLAPGQNFVIDFDREAGGIVFR